METFDFFIFSLALSLAKLLLLPFYVSTDYEVHRHWKALTFSQPISNWYKDESSIWTLDYPPFFAYFELMWANLAYFFEPDMLQLKNLNFDSSRTRFLMRSSVIIADLVLIQGVHRLTRLINGASTKKELFTWLILCNAGLLMVDHVHFQYNGFLIGLYLTSISLIMERRLVFGGLIFALLINFKHIFLYSAPVYFVYLLRAQCLKSVSSIKDVFSNSLKLGLPVLSTFALSLGPFLYMDQFSAILTRLFPFKRGLSHAYWAPNFWALYNFLDKCLGFYFKNDKSSSGSSSGMVGEFEHSVLPSVPSYITFVLTLLLMMPVLLRLLFKSKLTRFDFLHSLVLCSLTAFMTGWHVHEKAILTVVLPMSVAAAMDTRHFTLISTHWMTTVANVSLFPLLFRPQEALLKIMLAVTNALLSWKWVQYNSDNKIIMRKRDILAYIILIGVVIIELIVHPLVPLLHERFPFVRLMLYSVICALGNVYWWLRMHWDFFKLPEESRKRKTL